jgi:hypothetical protein
MNVKKSLENTLRGWFPKEPTLPRMPAKLRFYAKPKECSYNVISIPYNTNKATNFIGVQAIFWTLFSLFNINQIAGQGRLPLPYLIVCIIAGLACGSTLGILYVQRLLHRLAADHKAYPKSKDYLLLLGPLAALLIVGFVFLVPPYFLSSPPIFPAWATILFSLTIALWNTWLIQMLIYQKKNDMYILSSSAGFFEIPHKRPTTPVNLGNDWPVSEPANDCERNGLKA